MNGKNSEKQILKTSIWGIISNLNNEEADYNDYFETERNQIIAIRKWTRYYTLGIKKWFGTR